MIQYKASNLKIKNILYSNDFYILQRKDGVIIAGSTSEEVVFDVKVEPGAIKYLKKNNKRITVNEARRLIIAIDPSLRDEARIEANPREVAQIADSSNDYWKY